MKPLQLLLLAILLPAISFAQKNFKPGYIITTKGDTVKGFVDYREWETNPSVISFKYINGSVKNITPAEARFVNIDNQDAFERYTGPISNDETNENRLTTGRDTSFLMGDVFLRVLQKGKVINFYSYADATKPRFFYSDPKDNIVHELIYRVYYNAEIVDRFKGHTVNDNIYIQQITAIAIKANVLDDKLQNLLEHVNYTLPSLIKITTKMNGLSKQKLYNESDSNSNFDIYGGLAINASQTQPHSNYKDAGGTSHIAYLPKVILGFNAYVNPNTRQLVFSVEASATQNRYLSLYQNNVFPYVGIHYSFTQTILSLTPLVGYNFYNAEKLKVFAGLGFNLSKFSYSDGKYIGQDGSDVNHGLYPFYFLTSGNSMVYRAGALINNRYQVYASYTSAYYYSLDPYFGLATNSFQVGVNYFFGKRK